MAYRIAYVVMMWCMCGVAHAQAFKAWVYATLPDTPEGLAVDAQGTLYATLFHRGEIVRLQDDGTATPIAWVPSPEESGKGRLVGLEIDKAGNIYVAYKANSRYDSLDDPHHPACKDALDTTSGVYKVEAHTAKVTAVATRGQGWPMCFPNDVAIDNAGNLYVTDLTYAGIWKITPKGKVTMWSDHPLLNWSSPPYSGLPLGVNVLVLDKQQKNIYAATDGDPMVVRIPIKKDGSADEPVVLSRGHSPFDGIELDDEGNIYLSEIIRNEIMVLSPDGRQRVMIATPDNAPLDNNASLVLRNGVLYAANLGFSHPNKADATKTIVAISGFPKPKKGLAEHTTQP